MSSNPIKRQKPQKGAHGLIANVAMNLAGAHYEELAKDNIFYRMWPNQRTFIRKCWSGYVETARDILIAQLAMPNVSDHEKNAIYEAVQMDGALNPPVAHAQAEAARLSLH